MSKVELEKCGCCGASMSPRARACPTCGDVLRGEQSLHERAAWVIVSFTAILAWCTTFYVMFLKTGVSAVQQCSVVAAALGFTVSAYCYARAVEKRDR